MKRIVAVFLFVLSVIMLTGCASTAKVDGNYLAYLEAMKQKPIIEIEAAEGQTLTISGLKRLAVYGNGSKSEIHPFQTAPTFGTVLAQEFGSLVRTSMPYALGAFTANKLFNFAGDAVKNAGHNTAISGSYNRDRHDTGSYRDFTGSTDQSNRSINNSYNPFDRHDINDSYNPIDRHDVYQSPYNPVDRHDTSSNSTTTP